MSKNHSTGSLPQARRRRAKKLGLLAKDKHKRFRALTLADLNEVSKYT